MNQSDGSTSRVVGFIVPHETAESVETTQTPSTDASCLSGSPLVVSIPPSFQATPRGPPSEAPFTRGGSKSSTSESILHGDPSTTIGSDAPRQMTPTDRTNAPPPLTAAPPSQPSAKQPKQKAPKKDTPANTRKPGPGGKAKSVKGVREGTNAPCIALFAHLEPFQPFSRQEMMQQEEFWSLDPVFVQFCVDYGERKINESTACKALLEVWLQALQSFQQTKSDLFYTREFLTFLNHHIKCLIRCRAMNVAMRNAIKVIKVEVSKLKSGVPLEEGRDAVRRILQNLIEERVDVASFIAKEAKDLIQSGDVILTYSASETVLAVLSDAWSQREVRFRVVVVDVRPECEAKSFLHRLMQMGIPCTYLFLNALSFALKGVTKILIGASAVLSNGTVVSRAGSAAVAMMAHRSHIPTIVCCQTLKFHERVQLDSFTHNELGDATELLSSASDLTLDHSFLSLLNIRYDLMPAAFVSMIVSELGILPASSVPVILREQASSEKEPPPSRI